MGTVAQERGKALIGGVAEIYYTTELFVVGDWIVSHVHKDIVVPFKSLLVGRKKLSIVS
jgi:hypothetical protein